MATGKEIDQDSTVAAHWTEEDRKRIGKVRALAERCAASVPLDYKLESTLLMDYPDGWDELLAVCGEEDAGQRYTDLYEGVRDSADDNETREYNLWALDSVVGERLAAWQTALSLFADALHERRQREYRQLTAEDLTRALLNTEGKFQSAQERAVAILKG